MRRVLVFVLALLTVGVAAPALADPPAPPGTPTAHPFDGVPTVGPLFRGALGAGHECTASVVDSPSRDLLLTAAHCVYGTVVGWKFAPGYVNGATPFGVWRVTAAFVTKAWQTHLNTQYDVAILRVAKQHGQGIEDVTGANVLASAPRAGSAVTDIAYNAGVDDRPVRCTTSSYDTRGYPTFNCHGYVGGSSGSPWLQRAHGQTLVRGVIGGLHQGGCYEYTSYSSRFTYSLYALLVRASHATTGDDVPVPGGDGC